MNEAPKTRLPGAVLTVIIRDDSPMIHCGDSPSYRTVSITATNSGGGWRFSGPEAGAGPISTK
jgi:hypothetical protein